jgi:hypothetical protein
MRQSMWLYTSHLTVSLHLGGTSRNSVRQSGQMNGIHEVTGSIPVSSTNSSNN